jgi:hypothetical protein
MRASTQSVTHTSCSGSMVRTVSRSSVAWCPDSGATSSTFGSLRGFASSRLKWIRLQNGLASATSALTGTRSPPIVV